MPDKTFPVPKRAMAVYAHPDDVDFGCSGTLAAWIERGTHVTYCVITSGQKGTWDPKMTPKQMAQLREREQRAAGEAIGVKGFVFLGHEDGELEVSMKLREEVCLAIREHNIWFDISGTLDKKIKALQSHESQVGRHENFPERIRAMTKNAGAAWDLPAAEAFRYLELG